MNTQKRELNKKISENFNLIDETNKDTSFFEKRSNFKDRRKLHTFLANDRRSGIADRREKS